MYENNDRLITVYETIDKNDSKEVFDFLKSNDMECFINIDPLKTTDSKIELIKISVKEDNYERAREVLEKIGITNIPGDKIIKIYKRKRNIVYIIFFLFAIFSITGIVLFINYQDLTMIFKVIYVSVIAVFLIFYSIIRMIFWRCPKCNEFIGRGWNPKYCKTCGAGFRK